MSDAATPEPMPVVTADYSSAYWQNISTLYQANLDALDKMQAEKDTLNARIAELERQLEEINGRLPSLLPDECITERAALADEYIAAGQPPQKVNWMYAQAIKARRRCAELEKERDAARSMADAVAEGRIKDNKQAYVWRDDRDSALALARELERKFAAEKESYRLTNSALIKYRTEAGTKGLLIQTLEKRLANTRKLAREAVGVMEKHRCPQCQNTGVYNLVLLGEEGLVRCSACASILAFLAKPEVKALKGGE